MNESESPEGPQTVNRAHLLRKYKDVKIDIEEKLYRRLQPKIEDPSDLNRFNSAVRVATAEAFKPLVRSPEDELTGLIKKREFEKKLSREISKAKRSGDHIEICFVDLDGFKTLNDTYGHLEGDEALRLVAKTLKSSVRSYDTIARLGGDEFGIILPFNGEKMNVSRTKEIAENLNSAIKEATESHPGFISLAGSIGFTEFIGGVSDADLKTLYKQAETAMYNAKLAKGTHAVKWQEGMTAPKNSTSRR